MSKGDNISGELGDENRTVGVGKGIQQTANENTVNVRIPAERKRSIEEELRDIRIALVGDDMAEKPGLIRRMGNVERHLSSVEGRVGNVEGRLSTVESKLIDITELITVRNETRGKIHISLTQLIVFIIILLLLVLVIAPWLQARLIGGSVDGRIGVAIFVQLLG